MKFFAMVMMVFALNISLAHADGICGRIYSGDENFYIEMSGNAHAQLVARDTIVFKPLTALKKAVGTNACLQGEWVSDYVFQVLRVN